MRIPSSTSVRRVLVTVATLILASPLFAAVPFSVGDVFAGVGRGKFNHFSPTGTLLETLSDGQIGVRPGRNDRHVLRPGRKHVRDQSQREQH